jgi:cytochrome c551
LKKWVIIPIISLFLLLAACNTTKQDTTKKETNLSAEETLFQNHCANCHGGQLEGAFGPALTQVGKTYSKEQILEIIQKGKGSMPSQSFIPPADQEKLATWLANKK